MSARHELYVGYLPTPAAHRRLVRVVVPVLTLMLALVGALVVGAMRDPGRATWDTGNSQRWEGRLALFPYPMLLTDGGETQLVVEIGKVGAHDRVATHAGRRVTLEGFAIERDGRKMIELLEGDDAFVEVGDEAWSDVADVTGARPVEVVGEIVDGKCFLGAMKPGDGKAHKACAVLCIVGGLPAMVRTRDASGNWVYPLLLVDGAQTPGDRVLDLVGEPVRIEGIGRASCRERV
jgi:hypothetical protein